MATGTWLDELESACHRYGPGRLPGAEKPTIGAGYAGAAAALGVVVAFATVMLALDGWPVAPDGSGVALAVAAVVAVPLVVPTAFASAAVVRRYLPSSVPYFGAVAGVLATLLTYLVAVVALFGIGLLVAVTGSAYYGPLVEAVRFAGLFGVAGFVLTAWMTIPVGCLSGYVHERVRRST